MELIDGLAEKTIKPLLVLVLRANYLAANLQLFGSEALQ
jgi:hypothetical protein